MNNEEYLEEKKGYIRDFATGRLLKHTPEEEIRQILEKKLVEEYGYSKDQIEIEYPIQKGSKKIGLADIVVFRDEKKSFDNIYIIAETKSKEKQQGKSNWNLIFLQPMLNLVFGLTEKILFISNTLNDLHILER